MFLSVLCGQRSIPIVARSFLELKEKFSLAYAEIGGAETEANDYVFQRVGKGSVPISTETFALMEDGEQLIAKLGDIPVSKSSAVKKQRKTLPSSRPQQSSSISHQSKSVVPNVVVDDFDVVFHTQSKKLSVNVLPSADESVGEVIKRLAVKYFKFENGTSNPPSREDLSDLQEDLAIFTLNPIMEISKEIEASSLIGEDVVLTELRKSALKKKLDVSQSETTEELLKAVSRSRKRVPATSSTPSHSKFNSSSAVAATSSETAVSSPARKRVATTSTPEPSPIADEAPKSASRRKNVQQPIPLTPSSASNTKGSVVSDNTEHVEETKFFAKVEPRVLPHTEDEEDSVPTSVHVAAASLKKKAAREKGSAKSDQMPSFVSDRNIVFAGDVKLADSFVDLRLNILKRVTRPPTKQQFLRFFGVDEVSVSEIVNEDGFQELKKLFKGEANDTPLLQLQWVGEQAPVEAPPAKTKKLVKATNSTLPASGLHSAAADDDLPQSPHISPSRNRRSQPVLTNDRPVASIPIIQPPQNGHTRIIRVLFGKSCVHIPFNLVFPPSYFLLVRQCSQVCDVAARRISLMVGVASYDEQLALANDQDVHGLVQLLRDGEEITIYVVDSEDRVYF